MGRSGKSGLTRADLELLHEALTYMRKRTFDQVESVRIKGILDQIEDLLLANGEISGALRLSPPEQDAMSKQIDGYCEELTQRGASLEGREQAGRLRRLVSLPDPVAKKKGWLRRFFGL